LREVLQTMMWGQAGLIRHAAMPETAQKALMVLHQRPQHVRVSGSPRLNAEWQEYLNLDSLLTASEMIVASALQRKESRGAHCRSDDPWTDDGRYLQNVYLQRDGESMRLWLEPVRFTRLQPTGVATRRELEYMAQEGE
jgi:succinate dehydrogenase/fumarate reductase flavoprotein subunit